MKGLINMLYEKLIDYFGVDISEELKDELDGLEVLATFHDYTIEVITGLIDEYIYVHFSKGFYLHFKIQIFEINSGTVINYERNGEERKFERFQRCNSLSEIIENTKKLI